MIYMLMIGAILWLFFDNQFLKKNAEALKERVKFLEFYTFPKEYVFPEEEKK